MDPVMWFLFHDKKGVCTDFNTAFVLLARTIGLPSRVVDGFNVNPDAANQTVVGAQAHCYAEVLFDNIGWITFDATASGDFHYNQPNIPGLIQTETNITGVDSVVFKGHSFNVIGTVTDTQGNALSNLIVQVVLTNSSVENGTIVGQGTVYNGAFNISCTIPDGLAPGNYQLFAVTLGSGVYNGSMSDPTITVLSNTVLAVVMPQEAIINRMFWVNGSLYESSTGDDLANEKVTLTGDNQTITAITGANGTFAVPMIIGSFGTFEINAYFAGDGDYLSSSSSQSIVIPPFNITPLTQNLIRGEVNVFKAKVMADQLPSSDMIVSVDLDGVQIFKSQTDSSGYLTGIFNLSSTYPLGISVIKYSLDGYPFSVSQNAKVMASTSITAGMVENGDLVLTAQLLDNNLEPIGNQSLGAFTNSSGAQIGLTNATGYIVMSFKSPDPSSTKSVAYSVGYNGSEFLLPSSYQGVMAVPTGPIFSMTNILIIVTAIGVCVLPAAFFVARRKSKGSAVTVSAQVPTQRKEQSPELGSYGIALPPISSDMPNVWGAWEPLDIAIRYRCPGGGKVDLNIDESITGLDPKKSMETKIQSFGKGVHRISLSLNGEKIVEKELRIVDYREEIVSLYNQFFRSMKQLDHGIVDEMTPREFEAVVKSRMGPERHHPLNVVITTFETANYSLHRMAREDYVKIYLNLKELDGDAALQ
jgi:hypothetical protein